MSFARTASEVLRPDDIAPAKSFRLARRLIKRPVAVVAIVIIIIIYGAGIFAPLVSPYGFNEADFDDRFASPSLEHPLGTDRLGRDTLSRLIWSAQTTVIISAAAVVTGSLVFGVTAGLVSGYFGGRTDAVIMRIADTLFSVPTILLLLIINSTMKGRVDALFRDIEDFLGTDWIVSSGLPSYFLVFGALGKVSFHVCRTPVSGRDRDPKKRPGAPALPPYRGQSRHQCLDQRFGVAWP